MFIFPYIGNVIIPTDELIFFRGVGIPPSSRPETENVIGFDALIANRFTHSAWSPEFSLIHSDVLEMSQKSAKCPSNG